jgi:hypothetical protein
MKIYLPLLIFLLSLCNSISHAQQRQYTSPLTMQCDNKQIETKVKELVTLKKNQGFDILDGGFMQMENNLMQPIMVNMQMNHLYHFIVVGQPELNYMEVALGHESLGGDIIRDRIRKHRDKTYFTEFNFVAPFSGNFLLAITERVNGMKKGYSTAVYMMHMDGVRVKP